jgi:internalin A
VTNPSNHRWHPWLKHLRFSVRGLIGLIVLIGAGLGWLVHIAREAGIQRAAVLAIERTGGVALYEWEWKDNHYIGRGAPTWPQWLVDRVGIDYFGTVRMVATGERTSDNEMALIGQLPELEGLIIRSPGVSDAGMEYLRGLNRLESLSLWEAGISDTGLSRLRTLRGLQRLKLGPIKVSDWAITQVATLNGLRVLEFDYTDVNDASLAYLTSLPNLRQLFLEGPSFSDQGSKHLEQFTHLERLQIESTRITDAGKVDLKRLSGVEVHCDEGTSKKTWFKSW